MNKNCYLEVFGRIAATKASVIENSQKRCTLMLEFPESWCHLGTLCLADGHLLGSCTCQIFSGLSKALRMSGRRLPPKIVYIPDLYLVLSYEGFFFFFCCASLCCLSLKNVTCKRSMPCPFLWVMVKVKRPHRPMKVVLYPGEGCFLLLELSKC